MVRQLLVALFVLGIPVFAAPPKTQLVPWTATFDPPKEILHYAKDVRLTLPAKNVGVRFLAANVDRSGRYLAVGLMTDAATQSWTLIDLVTGKSETSLSEKMWLDNDCLLSPYGAYFAGNGVDLPTGTSFQVWSMNEKKRVANLKRSAGVDTPEMFARWRIRATARRSPVYLKRQRKCC